MDDRQELKFELKSLVEDFITSGKGSRVSLAKDAGVAYNTISRILQLEAIPSLESVLGILKVLLGQEQVVGFIKRHYPDFGSLMENQFKQQTPEFVLDENWDEILRDRVAFAVVCLSAKKNGVSMERIQNYLGQPGVRTANILLDEKVLIKSDGNLFCPEFVILQMKTLLYSLRHSIGLLEENHEHAGTFHAGWQVEGLNEEGLAAAKQALREAEMKIIKIRKDPKFQGDISTFSGTILGVIDPDDFPANRNFPKRNESSH